MCDVTTAALVLKGGSTLLQATGQYAAGQAEGAILDRNADIARRKAADAIVRGDFMAGRTVSEGGKTVAGFRAQASSSGFDVQSGANVQVGETIRGVAALDAEMIKTNALREALGFEVQAQTFNEQARLSRRQGKFAAIGSLLGGAGKLAGGLSVGK